MRPLLATGPPPSAARPEASPGQGFGSRILRWIQGLANPLAAGSVVLRVEARLALGPKKSLALVECRGRHILLALAGDQIVPVLELPEPAVGASRRTRRRKDAAR